MNSKERVKKALNHQSPDRIPMDFGSTGVTGIHIIVVEKLRKHFGLPDKPIKAIEPYQMLGEVEEDLKQALGIDTDSIGPKNNMFGIPQEGWKEWKTHWGQVVLVPANFNMSQDDQGSTYIYPEGETTVSPSAKMPRDSYFFDAIIRQEPIDEEKLQVEDNLEEFKEWTGEDIEYWQSQLPLIEHSERAVVGNFGGTALGDIALVPAMFLKHPKGIRDIEEWYISTIIRSDYVKELFDRQSDIAVRNLEKAYQVIGEAIDVLFICGTDFGTQDSTFCSTDTYREIWLPYYQKITGWIHEHTSWKVFKHSCGAVASLMDLFIESGFDILNPVQINAAGMDTTMLKEKYGDKLTFWGGGVDTQHVLAFDSPEAVREQVLRQCEIFGKNGGFVFNTVHNIQANVPLENVLAMFSALSEFNENKILI